MSSNSSTVLFKAGVSMTGTAMTGAEGASSEEMRSISADFTTIGRGDGGVTGASEGRREGVGIVWRGRVADPTRLSQDISIVELSREASRVNRSRQVSTAALASLIFSRKAVSL